jgi:hypothetical protein
MEIGYLFLRCGNCPHDRGTRPLIRIRGVQWPISLAVLDQQGQMLLLTIKPDWAGITVHYPRGVGGLHMSLCPPVHRLLVEGDGRGIKGTLTDTGGWLPGSRHRRGAR